jgi:hypothetical protein
MKPMTVMPTGRERAARRRRLFLLINVALLILGLWLYRTRGQPANPHHLKPLPPRADVTDKPF